MRQVRNKETNEVCYLTDVRACELVKIFKTHEYIDETEGKSINEYSRKKPITC
jgi:hypothetical protein